MSDTRLSMREQLMAAVDQHGFKDEAPVERVNDAPAPKGEPPAEVVRVDPLQPQGSIRQHEAPKEKIEAKVETKEAKTEERPRDETGKFVARKAPGQLKKELQPVWEKPGGHTPEEWLQLQDEFIRRESDHSKNSGELQKKLGEIEPKNKAFDEVFSPYRERLSRQGIEPVSFVKQLLAMADYADRDFAGFVSEQARMRGVDLSALIQQQVDAPQGDPRVVALENQLRQITAQLQGNQQQAQQRTQSEVAQHVQAFQSASNSDGSPKHPHFERVKGHMGSLMGADAKLTLEDAYRDACYAVPEIREAILADEWSARESKRLEELKRAEDAAKSNRGGPNGQAPSSLPRGSSIRAQLLSAWDSQAGNARVQ